MPRPGRSGLETYPAKLDEFRKRPAKPRHRYLAVRREGRAQLGPSGLVAIGAPGLDQFGAGEFVVAFHGAHSALMPEAWITWVQRVISVGDTIAHEVGRRWRRDVAAFDQLLLDIRQPEDVFHLFVEAIDNRARRARRRGKAEPGHELDLRQCLGDDRRVGHQQVVRGRGQREQAQLLALDTREGGGRGVDHEIDAAGQDIGQGERRAAIGYRRHAHAAFEFDPFGQDVIDRAERGDRIGDLVGLRFRLLRSDRGTI